MGNEKLVTIAIPAYKGKYLAEAIQSLLNQTYSTIEIIIVDDRSPENIRGILSNFNDERIHYFLNEQNVGKDNPARNWNECLSHANGEFFALLCDDDLYEPNFVETMLSLAEKYPQTQVFRSRANFIDAEGKEVNKYASAPEWETWDDYLWHVCRNYRSQTISEWFYRTEILRKSGGYALLPFAWYADYLSIFCFAKEGGIASTSSILVHFRLSGQNISSQDNKNNLKKIEAQQQYRTEVTKLLEGHPEKDSLLGALDWLLRQHLKYNLEHTPRKILLYLYLHSCNFSVKKSMIWHAFWHKRE